MLEYGPNNPPRLLDIAEKMMPQYITRKLRSPSFSFSKKPFPLATRDRCLKILDRWALNQPDQFKALVRKGEVVLIHRMLEQAQEEAEALLSDEGTQMRLAGYSPMEILTALGVDTRVSTFRSIWNQRRF